MGKIRHKRLVKVFTDMGYEEEEIYPSLNIVILRMDDSYITVNGSNHFKGRCLPDEDSRVCLT